MFLNPVFFVVQPRGGRSVLTDLYVSRGCGIFVPLAMETLVKADLQVFDYPNTRRPTRTLPAVFGKRDACGDNKYRQTQ